MNGSVTNSRKDWDRTVLPIGTVRIRDRGTHKVRMVKVRMTGPIAGRWIHYARWWWEKHRGRVPASKRVCHIDGDTLNDDPSNYELLTPGDVVFLAHDLDPKMSERNYAKCRAATAEHNRLRGRLRRETAWLPTRWYPVDFAGKRIVNQPVRQEWQAYAPYLAVSQLNNGINRSNCRQIALGWPGRNITEACVLHVLTSAGEPMSTAAIYSAIQSLRVIYRWAELASPGTLNCTLTLLRKAGLIFSTRSRVATHHLTIRAQSAGLRPSPIIAVRGCHFSDEQFAGFGKYESLDAIHPTSERWGEKRQRRSTAEILRDLAHAMEEAA